MAPGTSLARRLRQRLLLMSRPPLHQRRRAPGYLLRIPWPLALRTLRVRGRRSGRTLEVAGSVGDVSRSRNVQGMLRRRSLATITSRDIRMATRPACGLLRRRRSQATPTASTPPTRDSEASPCHRAERNALCRSHSAMTKPLPPGSCARPPPDLKAPRRSRQTPRRTNWAIPAGWRNCGRG